MPTFWPHIISELGGVGNHTNHIGLLFKAICFDVCSTNIASSSVIALKAMEQPKKLPGAKSDGYFILEKI